MIILSAFFRSSVSFGLDFCHSEPPGNNVDRVFVLGTAVFVIEQSDIYKCISQQVDNDKYQYGRVCIKGNVDINNGSAKVKQDFFCGIPLGNLIFRPIPRKCALSTPNY